MPWAAELNRVQVAVAVVLNAQQQVLIAQRHPKQHQGGLWEFPGGKVAVNETIFQALQRELQEEVNLLIETSQPVLTISHDYPDKSVQLFVHLVKVFSGKAQGLENQPLRWVNVADLTAYEFPVANQTIVEWLLQHGLNIANS